MPAYKRVAEVNLWGVVRVSQTFLPLIRQARGRIVNVASMAGLITSPGMSAVRILYEKSYPLKYCITKYGVEAFSDALRREMLVWGGRCMNGTS
jgi:NAD(P)-dependent dehydrogenase (short-subunit alcohol dehydrogenase family)